MESQKIISLKKLSKEEQKERFEKHKTMLCSIADDAKNYISKYGDLPTEIEKRYKDIINAHFHIMFAFD